MRRGNQEDNSENTGRGVSRALFFLTKSQAFGQEILKENESRAFCAFCAVILEGKESARDKEVGA